MAMKFTKVAAPKVGLPKMPKVPKAQGMKAVSVTKAPKGFKTGAKKGLCK
jgi:hypothetical protein